MPSRLVNTRVLFSGEQYDVDAMAYFAQLSPQPSTAYKKAINRLIVQLKSDGGWTELDRLWIHATEFQQHSRVSLRNPTSTPITEVNSPTWTANQGYTGNGSTMYLNTNYNPAVNGVKYTQNSASMFVYFRTADTVSGWIMGGFSAGTIDSNLSVSGGQAALNSNGSDTIISSSTGFAHARRTASNVISGYRNGVLVASAARVTNGITNANMAALARINSTGTAVNFSDSQISITGYGSGAINHLSFYTNILAFATTRGFNV